MIRSNIFAAVAAWLGMIALSFSAAQAAPISKIYVGAFSNDFDDPSDPSGVVRGSKYVVKTSFDTADVVPVPAADRISNSRDMYVVQLTDDPTTPGATNTYELFIPTQGYGILTQTGQDHYFLGSGYAPTAEIQFFGTCTNATTCAAQFRGFEFESNYLRTNSPTTPAATDLIFEQFTADANLIDALVTTYEVKLLDESFSTVTANSGTLDVRSESASPFGGQANPGVFFREADPIVAEAGATPLVYSASQLSVTTNAGTELVTETAAPIVPGQLRTYPSALDEQPRQADNDLGAGRTDKEDFLTFDWSIDGVSIAGNLDGSRLDRTVTGSPAHFDNLGTRAVSNVNLNVGIAGSGLATTVDAASFGLTVTEAMTGLSDTDTVAVSYQNAPVASVDAGPALVYDAANMTRTADGSVVDPDLAVNALIPGFESHSFEWKLGATTLGTGEDLALGIVASGLLTTTDVAALDFIATDFAGASDGDTTGVSYANALPSIAMASATTMGDDLLFELTFDDLDLSVNGLISGFEELAVQILVDTMDYTALFGELIATGSQLLDQATLLGTFGEGSHLFEARISDRVILASGGSIGPVTGGFQFEVTAAPEPATLGLLALGALGLGGSLRRRRPMDGTDRA